MTECFDNNEPTPSSDDVTCEYFFDSLSRKVEETQQIGGLAAKALTCDFDIQAAGAVAQCSADTYPDGRTTEKENTGQA